MIRNLLCVLIALVALVVTSAVVHLLFPQAIPRGVAAKLKFFAAHKDEFNTLMVGTSSIYYSVSPEIFDRITGENGLPTRTFNFGIDAMRPPENFYVLDQILKAKPRNLKWVFLETADIQTELYEVLGTQRAVYWHDWPRTELAVRKALNPRGEAKWYSISRPWVARRFLVPHLSLFAQRFVNLGQIDLLSSQEHERSAGEEVELGPRRDGYRLAGEAMSAQDAESFQRRLAEEVAEARPKPIDSYAEGAYREYARRIHQIGAESFFIVPPVMFQSPITFKNPPSPGPLLLFNDSKAYPQLYDTRVRIDDSHLTKEGAEEFTQLLAREFVRQVRER